MGYRVCMVPRILGSHFPYTEPGLQRNISKTEKTAIEGEPQTPVALSSSQDFTLIVVQEGQHP